MRTLTIAALLFLIACSDPSTPQDSGLDAGLDASADASAESGIDASADAGRDSGMDASTPKDAGPEAGVDAGPDAAMDAGPICECSSGACCDGCHYRPSSYICQGYTVTSVDCVGSGVCSGYGLIIQTIEQQRQCSGWKAACDGLWVNDQTSYVNCDSDRGFPPYARCVSDSPTSAHCATGPSCVVETP